MRKNILSPWKRVEAEERWRSPHTRPVFQASQLLYSVMRRSWLVATAFLVAFSLTLLVPGIASAHAALLRSDPAQDAVLTTPPHTVHLWFSEDLNPTFSTATVVNGQNQRVDTKDAHVAPGDTKEMDLTLKPDLPPAVYIVIYRTHSADDGHTLSGSFLFTVARPDGTVPTLSQGQYSSVNAGAGILANQGSGQLDGPTLFTLIITTLIELGVVFWVGAQFWTTYVLPQAGKLHSEERPFNESVARRFEERFSLPVLLVLLLANMGILVSQALSLTGGQWAEAFAPSLLLELVTTSRFGIYWVIRGVIILGAIVLAWVAIWRMRRGQASSRVLVWVNLLLGIGLLLAISLSGHAAAVDNSVLAFSVLIDWLHLLAAALWVGGMFYIVTAYLPTLRSLSVPEQARSLLRVIPCFSPLAIAGVILMSITGPFSATIRLSSWDQFLLTAYGRTLLLKIILVGGLLLTSAYHVGLVRPRLRKIYAKYLFATARLHSAQVAPAHMVASGASSEISILTDARTSKKSLRVAWGVRQREERLAKQTRHLVGILRYEPLLGVAVLVCVGLLNAFGGTLGVSATAASHAGHVHTLPLMGQPFVTTAPTTDGRFSVSFSINPDRFGTNDFVVRVLDIHTHGVIKNVGVTLYTTMLGMEMGTSNIHLLPDGKGYFRGKGDLTMGGRWQIRIQIRTLDNTLHEATTTFSTLP
ncbi:MAG TPA: copper resistance protein CopC [Ktedonobacteraceae bacterium]|nr:copper resistance protein CopC [Ktedonobacteraceae bacterium]